MYCRDMYKCIKLYDILIKMVHVHVFFNYQTSHPYFFKKQQKTGEAGCLLVL